MKAQKWARIYLVLLGYTSFSCNAWTQCETKVRYNHLLQLFATREGVSVKEATGTNRTADPYGRTMIQHRPYSHGSLLRGPQQRQQPLQTEEQTVIADPLLHKRDRAILSFHLNLGMDLEELKAFFDDYPELYSDCPSLVTRLLFLLHDLEFPKKKLIKLFQSDPGKMATMLMNDVEQALQKGKENNKETSQVLDPRASRKNKAFQALHSHIGMDQEAAEKLLAEFPELYEICPSLVARLMYMLQQVNLSPEKLQFMFKTHPERTVQMLMRDTEQKIKGSVAILQEELQMSIEEIVSGKLWYVPRNEVRSRIATLKQYFSIPDIKKVVQLEPGLLGGGRHPKTRKALTTSLSRKESDAQDMCKIFSTLRNELKATDEDIFKMLENYPGVFLESADRVQSHVEFLLYGPVGKGLGLVLRRGITTRNAETESEAQEIERQRTLDLLVGTPILTITKNLVPIVNYLQSIGCEVYDIGRIAYRRPQLFQYEVESLKFKVDYFCKELDMSEGNLPGNAHVSRTVLDLMATMPDVFTFSIKENIEFKFQYFREELGFNTTALRTIFSNRPQILCLSLENNVIPKIEYLLTPIKEGGAGLTIEELQRLIISFPQGLRESLNLRIQPRCQAAIKQGMKIPDDLPNNFLTMTESRWSTIVFSEIPDSKKGPKTTIKTKKVASSKKKK